MSFDEFLIKTKVFFQKAWRATVAYVKAAKIELLILLGAVVLDLIVKILIGANMYDGQTIVVIPNFFHITYVKNYRAAFGSFFGLEKVLPQGAITAILIIFTLAAMIFFTLFMIKSKGKHKALTISLGLIIGGALGNFIDRLFLGYVRDMFEIVFFGLDIPFLGGKSFAIFNIADMALTFGVITFAVYFIFIYKEPKKPKAIYTGEENSTEVTNSNLSEEDSTELTKETLKSIKNNNCEQDVNEKSDKTAKNADLEPKCEQIVNKKINENANCEQIVNKNKDGGNG